MTSLVDPAKIAARLGITDPSEVVTELIEEAIADSEAKVLGFLNRDALVPEESVLVGTFPDPTYPMTENNAWPQAVDYFDDTYKVVSWVPNADDPNRYDVTFSVGLDARDTLDTDGNVIARHPVARFIARDAQAQLADDAVFCKTAGVARTVQSVSAGGQSISYNKPNVRATAQTTGSDLNITALRRYRRFSIYQRPMTPFAPWPYVR